MSKIKYLHIKYYEDYKKNLIDRNATFSVTKTSYSRKIKTGQLSMIFNQEGGNDYNVLALINSVRKDAKDYLANTSYEKRDSYIHFFDLFKMPKSDQIIKKIDVRSAYWGVALKKGVIRESTNNKLLEAYEGRPVKEMKDARLKALGSLATKKMTEYFVEGKKTHEDLYTEVTKEIYMDICRDVDNLMRDCVSENQTVIYYYWDCIFVPENTAGDVLKFFKKRDYNVSVEETRLLYVDIFNDGAGYLLSESDNKAYMVRKESAGLLEIY